MSEPSIVVHATVTRDHFADFSAAMTRAYRSRHSGLLRGMLFLALAMIALGGIMKLAEVNLDKAVLSNQVGPAEYVGIAYLLGAVLVLALWQAQHRSAVKTYSTWLLRDGGAYLGERTFRFDGEGIRADGPQSFAMTRWPLILGISEEPATLLFWTDPGAAIMVPRAAVGDAAAVERLLAYARARMVRPPQA